MRYIFICAAAAVMLSSCGLYSKYEGQTSVDPELYGEGVALLNIAEEDVVDSLTLGNISWREIFSDEKLQGYIEQGLANNADLRTAELSVEAVRSSFVASRLAYLPSLALAPQGSLAGVVGNGPMIKTYTLPVTASWDIDLFGRITNTKLQTKMMLEKEQFTAQAVRVEIVAGIANVYYTISMLEEQLVIALATEKSWLDSYDTAKAMKEAGMMTEAGLSQIEASLYGVQMSVLDLRKSLKMAENSMCSLLAIAPQPISGGVLDDVVLPSRLQLGVPLQMLSQRPDVMAAESALAASFYSENVARSSFYPSLSVTGMLGWTNSANGIVLDPAKWIYNAVGQLVQPIFNRGMNRAQLKIAKAQFEMTRVGFEQKLLDSGIEVNDALTSLLTSQENASLYRGQVASLRSAAASTSLLMKYGNTTYLEVLTAQQTLYNAELGLVSNRFDQMQSLVSLYKSLGGGRF